MKKSVSYFPVNNSEQQLLLRVRESDVAGRTEDLVEMIDQIAEARLTSAELEQAIQLLVASRQGEGLDTRFDNLEGRLKERIEKGLAEIEGRLSKRLTGAVQHALPELPVSAVPASTASMTSYPVASPVNDGEVPKDASLAFRIGPDLVWGPSASQFYVAVWRWLFDHDHVRLSDLPIQSGKRRFAVAEEPVHPSGKPFTRSDEVVPGAYVEVNLSRADIIRRARKYLGQYGVPFEVVVGSEA